ncbi:hypothetical protein V6N12_012548 [Hibiscus sabdariffa]|uniref:Secreted protein n=1 Tax=Hibiscus sabdariffa TaxID=183260 RepID=A0ABR2B5G8_9ROSI
MCWLFWKRRCRLLLASEVGVLDDVLVHGNQLTMECSRVGDKAMEPRDGRCLELHWNRPSVGVMVIECKVVIPASLSVWEIFSSLLSFSPAISMESAAGFLSTNGDGRPQGSSCRPQ